MCFLFGERPFYSSVYSLVLLLGAVWRWGGSL